MKSILLLSPAVMCSLPPVPHGLISIKIKSLINGNKFFPFSTRFGTNAYAFKVPKSTTTEIVKLGFTRLRLQVQETSNNQIDPCVNFTYGGTKDFGVQVKATVDGGWSIWGPCNASCGGGYHFRTCTNPKPSAEGATCSGPIVEACNQQACASSNGGKVAAGILVPLIIIGGAVGFWYYRKRKTEGGLTEDFTSSAPSGDTTGQTGSYQTAV